MQLLPNSPEFSWSHSRDRLLGECARAYYWRYYGSHGGWSDVAGAEARLAWRLKHLTTLHSVLGAAIHDEARRNAFALRDRKAPPTVESMLERVRATLRAACLSSDRAAFLRDPKGRRMLHSVFYDGRYDRGEVEAVAAKIDSCVRHLHTSPVWERLATLPPEAVRVETNDSVDWDGVRVYAAPDLAVLGEDDSCEIVDWKTGRRREEEEAREQLAGYAWFLQHRLGRTFREGCWTARAVYLQDGEEEQYVITRLDLLQAEHRIRESVERMRGLLTDPTANQPLPREVFSLVHPAFRFRCKRCQYFGICQTEMALPRPGGAPGSVS